MDLLDETMGRVWDWVTQILSAWPVPISSGHTFFVKETLFYSAFAQCLFCFLLFCLPVSHAPAKLLRNETTQQIFVHCWGICPGRTGDGTWPPATLFLVTGLVSAIKANFKCHEAIVKRGTCLLLAKSRTHTAISSCPILGLCCPSSLFLSLAQTPPTHSSFGLMGHKHSPKCKTLRASIGHLWPNNLETSRFYEPLSSSQATREGNCFRALPLLFKSIC